MGIENFHLPNSSMQILMVADELRYELISARVVTCMQKLEQSVLQR